MPEIDPDQTPLSSDELQRDALASGAEPDAPPLVEAQAGNEDAADAVAADVVLLPPG